MGSRVRYVRISLLPPLTKRAVWSDLASHNPSYAELLKDRAIDSILKAFDSPRDIAIPLGALSLEMRKKIPSGFIYTAGPGGESSDQPPADLVWCSAGRSND